MNGKNHCGKKDTAHNCDHRQPRAVTAEAALKNRHPQFVIDGEAAVLGVDGVAVFDALHSRKHDDEVQLYAFATQLVAVDLDQACSRCSKRKLQMISLLSAFSGEVPDRARSGVERPGPRLI